ncbi:MAG: alpha/beta fold hydrolase [Comamonas sp.]|nr:alpha/beta fold hydrolase [Comamonas sp.]
MKSKFDATSSKPFWPAPRWLARGAHRVAWRELGHADGECWLLLHGGPGGGCQPGMLKPFDLGRQRVIAPDQRGAGASRPRGCIQANHTVALVADLEALREHLGLQRWSLLAGSWGTVVALSYARQHPQRVQRLVLRGAFRLTRREIGGLLLPSARKGKALGRSDAVWPVKPGTPLAWALVDLAQLLQSGTPGVASLHALRGWALREMRDAAAGLRRSLLHARVGKAAALRREWAVLRRRQRRAEAELLRPRANRADRLLWARYRVQAHYLQHRGFVRPGALDGAVRALAQQGVAVDWVHGRFDAICPPANSRRWARMGLAAGAAVSLRLPSCGHLADEPAMRAALCQCLAAPPLVLP